MTWSVGVRLDYHKGWLCEKSGTIMSISFEIM